MEFRVLGPIEVVGTDGPRRVASGRQLALLALLLANANRIVSADRILDDLWGDEPPESGAKTVVFHVSRLRDALEPGRVHDGSVDAQVALLTTVGGGYRLRVMADELDAARFERLAADARGLLADDPAAARDRLVSALALWRGDRAYSEVADEAFIQPEVARLEEARLRALEDLADADLALGRHREAIEGLIDLVAANPVRERFRGQLVVALYRSGRQADALRVLAEGRAVLATELGIDPGPELRRLEEWVLRQDPRLDPPSVRRPTRNPYKGLRPFGEADAGDFFGREDLVARLVDRLGQVARAGRLLCVVGPSGSGKSSVVRAGLIPAMRTGGLPGSEHWPIAVMLPGTRPLKELASALDAALPHGSVRWEGSRAPGASATDTDDTTLASALAAATAPDRPVLLVIDQAEELFTLADDGLRAAFLAQLLGALAAPDGRLLVVATLRADALAHPLRTPVLGELVRAGVELVTPLDRDALERAILRPAEGVGAALEPGLASEIIADLGHQPGELPLLQFALTELFARGDGSRLTRAEYAAIGGVSGALARRADEAYAVLDLPDRELARQMLLRLVSVGPAGEPAARRVARAELDALAPDPTRAGAVLDAFAGRRLLSFDRDSVTGAGTVQIAHEALLARWPRLAGWVDEARDDLLMLRRLAEATADWTEAGRDRGLLLFGTRLDRLAAWASATHLSLDSEQRAFLDASLEERARQAAAELARVARERALERRAASRLRGLVVVLLVAVLSASSLSLALFRQGESEREQAEIAVARERAAASIGSLGKDARLALLLAWYAASETAGRGYVVGEAFDALHWALQASHVAYPGSVGAIAVRQGPSGARGVPVLPPEELMALAARQPGRGLSSEECRSFLHMTSCPAAPSAAGPAPSLDVDSAGSIAPVGQLAATSLAGTQVEVLTQLPFSLEAPLSGAVARDGITVHMVSDAGGRFAQRVASGDLPDLAILARPYDVASLGRAGLLVDLSGFLDRASLGDASVSRLLALDTIGSGVAWPAATGRIVGVPFAIEAESLIWYPKAAFDAAHLRVPTTRTELDALVAQMVRVGRTPWCLGTAGGDVGGASAVGFVEDEVLTTHLGPRTYDEWATGRTGFDSPAIREGFNRLEEIVFAPGSVLGGPASAVRTPQDTAAWPLSDAPPGCWLYLGGGTSRLDWFRGQAGTLASFPVPASEAELAGTLRGRLYSVVVLHDRPEVRRVLAALVAKPSGLSEATGASAMTATLASAGLWQVGADVTTLPEAVAISDSLHAGLFRVSVTDLVPEAAATAFAGAAAQLVASRSDAAGRAIEIGWLLAQVAPTWPTPGAP